MKKEPLSIASDNFCTLTLQLEKKTLEKIKQKALYQGISYEDLIRSIIHNTANSSCPLTEMIGANKGSGLYESVVDIDQTIEQLRNEWD